MKELTVTEKEAGQRADKFLLRYLGAAPKGFVYKMLRKKRIKLNGGRLEGGEILRAGDVFSLYLSEDTLSEFTETRALRRTDIRFSVVYEDENLLVMNKPAGLLSQPAGPEDESLWDQALFYLSEKGEYAPEREGAFVPAIANRLDRNTGGIVIMGKTLPAMQELSRVIREGGIEKYYLVLVKGEVNAPGTLTGVFNKDKSANKAIIRKTGEGSEIITKYRPLKVKNGFSLLEAELITGKSHQIRAHLYSADMPVAGDKKYPDPWVNGEFRRKYGLNHQFLFAHRVVWKEKTGRLGYLCGTEFTAKPPRALWEIERDIFG